jgi:hypothetical protein
MRESGGPVLWSCDGRVMVRQRFDLSVRLGVKCKRMVVRGSAWCLG